MQEAPDIIARLVARFDNDAAHYRGTAYNETQTCIDFTRPWRPAIGGCPIPGII
jgi:hypothetical protein